jgi:hypothetical protein
MAAPTIGADCDITLCHPDVNSGVPYGFILTPDPTHGRSEVSIQREIDYDTGIIAVYLFFSVMIADDLINPDGSEHTDSRETMYLKLLEYLDQRAEISIDTVLGTWLGIGSTGHSATELHLIKGSILSVKFANVTEYHPPADSDLVLGSLWQADIPEDDALTWDTTLWR